MGHEAWTGFAGRAARWPTCGTNQPAE